MRYRINGIALALGEGEALLPLRVASLLGLPKGAATDLQVMRRSLDARRARPPRFIYQVSIGLPDGIPFVVNASTGVTVTEEPRQEEEASPGPLRTGAAPPAERPVVVGCGPAGLFAALTLALKGMPPLLLERGKKVSERIVDVQTFWEKGRLNPESHVHFGEGGAGTFSDGKLTSRVKNPYTAWVKRVMADMGAPAEIMVEAHAHIGTDRLRAVVVNLRNRLIELGGEVRFEAKMTDLCVRDGRVAAVVVNGAEEIRTSHLALAIGQSADDTYRQLAASGVALAAKPFAVGLRVEHPQEAINRIQYGQWAGHRDLPPADYFLTAKAAQDRSVYSFCMCPGGQVIGCSAEAGGVVTNGMSCFRRDSPYANSALVVNVRAEDLAEGGPLAGLDFRRRIEARAFAAGGGDYFAPAQRLTDFLTGRTGASLGRCSFLPGVRETDLREVLPSFIGVALQEGVKAFGRKMPGFVTDEALLIGVETRTSSPVRILRDEEGQNPAVGGLFPCGEGAGYAGGIISSALDGIRAAERLAEAFSPAGHRGSNRRPGE
ncbi:MAG: NAD(P)/FAD-dependent oxidoreductase [Deltaproteobacteria bacterium]|nr:NAD(P)/FAD-dependent oxidoreductase [Deltaproteobacteria bacterium]